MNIHELAIAYKSAKRGHNPPATDRRPVSTTLKDTEKHLLGV